MTVCPPRCLSKTENLANVHKTEFNQKSNLLFVDIHQVFSLFFVPFYQSNVRLTTKLQLVQSPENNKYYIQSQEDLYQLNEVVKFFWPGGATILWLWQLLNMSLCVVGVLIFKPITMFDQRHAVVNAVKKGN